MADINNIVIGGRLTRDVELKQTQTGVAIVDFTIACDKRYGEGADFFKVVAWRQTAEFISKYFFKGSKILIQGEIQTNSYDNKEGKKVTYYQIVANQVYFFDSKKGNDQPADVEKETINPYTTSDINFETIGGDDDLPF